MMSRVVRMLKTGVGVLVMAIHGSVSMSSWAIVASNDLGVGLLVLPFGIIGAFSGLCLLAWVDPDEWGQTR